MSGIKTHARAVADVVDGLIVASVEIARPPERVFQALTTAEITEGWVNPGVFDTREWNGDVRVGGRWSASGIARGAPYTLEGEFLEVDPPHKLVQTWKASWDNLSPTTISYRLQAIEGGTRVTIAHSGFAGRPEACRDHSNGWEKVFGWLAGHLSPKANGAVFVNRLIGPRPSFPFDISDAERKVMADHAAFWAPYVQNGTVIVLGPVGDPAGPYGLGVVRATDASAMAALLAEDPAIKSEMGFRYDSAQMMATRTRY